MNAIFFLILRQMRGPLLLLSAVYAVATLGLTIVPGVTDTGETWYMGFFHAFYFVSFMGTTTGFGEIPYAFSEAQRMWTLVFIYITVATWIYTIGALITLLQNETLRNALAEYRFERRVHNLREPFYLICGFGATGGRLVHSLSLRRMQASVIDLRQDRIDALLMEDNPTVPPVICADARDPDTLIRAGIEHPMCRHVLALTNDNAANLHIALSASVLRPGMPVICRADSHSVELNMASFGNNYIIDPFATFAKNLVQAYYAPHQFLLYHWLHKATLKPRPEVLTIPKGRWLICGFGRFGRAVYSEMQARGIDVRVIEPNKTIKGLPDNTVLGLGTEAETLQEAAIESCVGIIAGTNNDSNNLSIILTARDIKPDLFVIARQCDAVNQPLFEDLDAEIVMQPSEVIANKIRTILTNPMVDEFLSLVRVRDDAFAKEVIDRIDDRCGEDTPRLEQIDINRDQAHAVVTALAEGTEICIADIIRNHWDREQRLPLLPLLHTNSSRSQCLPEFTTLLQEGDRILFAGPASALDRFKWNLQNEVALNYALSGKTIQQTPLGRWLERRRSSVG